MKIIARSPIFLAIGVFILSSACANRHTITYKDQQSLFEAAMEYFNNGKYDRAEELFKRFTYTYPTSGLADDAQFYLAESYYRQKDFEQAIMEYGFLIETFPASEYRQKAELRIAESYLKKSPNIELEQEDTKTAIRRLRRFIAKYPDSPLSDTAKILLNAAKEKLAQKMLVAIRTYRNLREYNAEKFYIGLLLKEYPKTSAYWEAKYYLAELLLREGKLDDASKIIDEIIDNADSRDGIVRKAKILGLKYGVWPFRTLNHAHPK